MMKKTTLILVSFLTIFLGHTQNTAIEKTIDGKQTYSSNKSEEDITFTTQSVSSLGAPYVIVDMNGDFLDDLVTVNTNSIRINYQKEDQTFDTVTITTPIADNDPTWSIAAGDLDGNGYMDLLYGGGSGATFMLANVNETSNESNNYASEYSEISPSIYIFSQRTNFVDINNDGNLDAFVCHDIDANVYFINDGNGGLITHQVNDGSSLDLGILGRNYATIWIDYDNDQDIDVFISKCGGSTEATKNRLYRNNGDGTYTDVSVASGLDSVIQTWSSAWGDFDNDGFMDVMVGASWGENEFMRNNGDGTFTNITAGSGFDTFDITSHEYIAKDFNNDGYIDVLASGYIMKNNGDMTFTQIANDVGQGAVGDVDNDGFLDVFTDGVVKVNDGTVGNWLKVNAVGVESNIDGIGARVEITSALGTQIRDIRSGIGFQYMSSLTAHFGIGDDTAIESVTIYWPSGNIDIINDPAINSTLNITEESVPLSINEDLLNNVSLYPNPVTNELQINTNLDLENSIIAIFDIQGKKVYNSYFIDNKINVSNLETGIYFLRIIQNDKKLNLKFIKK
ncbi:MAG: FG-GAP-like repeat-containing protein [Flavobacteriaceae bacterium]|nr:FG-GAP-like repeat-containing protein [Flavobacteriaceae bacterium]